MCCAKTGAVVQFPLNAFFCRNVYLIFYSGKLCSWKMGHALILTVSETTARPRHKKFFNCEYNRTRSKSPTLEPPDFWGWYRHKGPHTQRKKRLVGIEDDGKIVRMGEDRLVKQVYVFVSRPVCWLWVGRGSTRNSSV